MKIDFIIISGILVIISFLPFILFPLLRSKVEKTLKNKFKEEARKTGLNLSYEQHWNSNLAGIDILKRQFLLVQNPGNDLIAHLIDLNKINQIKLVPQYREMRLQEKQYQNLSRIDLEFYQNNSQEPLSVNLFDYELNYTQDLEMKNAEKLVVELRKYLIAQPVLKHTA